MIKQTREMILQERMNVDRRNMTIDCSSMTTDIPSDRLLCPCVSDHLDELILLKIEKKSLTIRRKRMTSNKFAEEKQLVQGKYVWSSMSSQHLECDDGFSSRAINTLITDISTFSVCPPIQSSVNPKWMCFEGKWWVGRWSCSETNTHSSLTAVWSISSTSTLGSWCIFSRGSLERKWTSHLNDSSILCFSSSRTKEEVGKGKAENLSFRLSKVDTGW